ncbi:MAG: phosphoglycerate kinase [Candidatus Deianiraeaceae bacterium]|jgi:phosphoglycerate kinase
MDYNLIQDVVVHGTVVVRTDLNVPISRGQVQDVTRILESYKTIKYILETGADRVVIISHFGRPKGKIVDDLSLKHIIPNLEEIYGQKVAFYTFQDIAQIRQSNAKIILLENIRFNSEEESNDDDFAKSLAEIGDFYVNDAFSASHRTHASVAGVAQYIKVYAGLLLQSEITTIENILHNTQKEKVCTIIGGSKVSTKFDLLKNLIHQSQTIILGGGMANTFLYAQGFAIGSSMFEESFSPLCLDILKKAQEIGTQIILPTFVITSKKFEDSQDIEVKHINNIQENDIIVDVSLEKELESIIDAVEYIVWNGPLGAFEIQPFKCGTESVARIIAKYTSIGSIKSIIGGGDVVCAIASSGLKNSMTYISTGGGAFLEWFEGRKLPGIDICKK